MPQSPRARHLKVWSKYAANITPGKRLRIDNDLPLSVASVRVSKLELKLALSMVQWLSSVKGKARPTPADVPWELIDRALRSRSGDASHYAGEALSTVSRLHPALWGRVTQSMHRASAWAWHSLRADCFPRSRQLAVYRVGASHPDDAVRSMVLARALATGNRTLFSAVRDAVVAAGVSQGLHPDLERYESLVRDGYHVGVASSSGCQRVHVLITGLLRGRRHGHAFCYEDVPDTVVRHLGLAKVVDTIRSCYDDHTIPYPIEWELL